MTGAELVVGALIASVATSALAANAQANEAKRTASYNSAVAAQRAQQRLEVGAGAQIRLAREGARARGRMAAAAGAAGGGQETAYSLFAQSAADMAMDQQQARMNALNAATGVTNDAREGRRRASAAADQAWLTFTANAASTGYSSMGRGAAPASSGMGTPYDSGHL